MHNEIIEACIKVSAREVDRQVAEGRSVEEVFSDPVIAESREFWWDKQLLRPYSVAIEMWFREQEAQEGKITIRADLFARARSA